MNLTYEQIQMIEKFNQFKNNSNDVFIINSRAGSGKTFILIHMFKDVIDQTLFLGPTGRSIKVMKENGLSRAFTIHSCIYGKPVIIENTEDSNADNEIGLRFDLKSLDQYDRNITRYIVVDEASMLTDESIEDKILLYGSGSLLNDLIQFAKTNETPVKFIFVGDDHQLPPVGDNKSKALDGDFLSQKYGLKVETHELLGNYRQIANSGIYQNMQMITNLIDIPQNDRTKLNFSVNNEDVITIDETSILHFYNPQSNKDIIIANENKLCKIYNEKIRSYLGFEEELVVGDKLIFTKNIHRDIYDCDIISGDFGVITKIGQKESRNVKRGDTIYQLDFVYVHIFIDSYETTIKGYLYLNALRNEEYRLNYIDQQLLFKDAINRSHLHKINSPSYKQYQKDLNEYELRRDEYLSERNEYKKYVDETLRTKIDVEKYLKSEYKIGSEFKPKLAKYGLSIDMSFLLEDCYFNAIIANYGNAITFYKAQGGSWENVYIDFSNLQGAAVHYMNLRRIYTAISRASKKLYLINPPTIGLLWKVKINSISKLKNPVMYKEEEYHPSSGRFKKLYEVFCEIVLESGSSIMKIREESPYKVSYFLNTDSKGTKIEIYSNKETFSTISSFSYLGEGDSKLRLILQLLENYR